MKILAFDTCLDKTYITLAEDEKILHSEIIKSNENNYHSAYLISTIIKVLKKQNMTMKDLNLIATDIGPGSFTGIRACTTVARVLAQQLNIKAVGISSLEILSKILNNNNLVILDARKNKGYVYDNEIKGALDLDEIDILVKDRIVITDKILYERIKVNAKETFCYEDIDYPLSEILSKLALTKNETDWLKLKPLYIQPPPIFGK